MKLPICLVALLLLVTGCSTVETHFEVSTDVRRFHHVFVRSASNDSYNVDQLIVQELRRLGYEASSGPRTMMPDSTEVVVDYEGQWDWDFRLYMIRLNVTVRNARTEDKLAAGQVFHPGVTNKSPEELVRVALDPIFGPKKGKGHG